MSLGRRIRQYFHGGDLTGSAPNPTVTQARGLRETTGPTTLAMGAVADGEFLKRSGSTITSAAGTSVLTADSVSAPVFAADAGSNDTYVATLSPVPSGYTTGTHYRFKANTANTGACTINFNSLGAKTIKKAAGGITTDLADNDIRAGQWVDLVYDGTNMQMQSTSGNAAGGVSGLSTNTIPKAASSTTLSDSDISQSGTDVVITGRDLKTRSVYSDVVGSANYNLDRNNGLRLGSDTGGFGFTDAYFDNVGRHTGFLVPTSTATGGGATFAYPARTYTQITSNQNDYNITENYFMRMSTDASRNITGMQNAVNDAFSGRQADGEVHHMVNVGSFDLVLKHQDAGSVAANRFLNSTGADITLTPNQAADIIYDATTARWRVYKKN